MPGIMDEATKQDLRQLLSCLVSPVKLLFFTKENACPECAQQHELLRELVSFSNKLELEVYDFFQNGDKAADYGVDKTPATAVIGKKDYGIRFYGFTARYEFAPLLAAIVMVSTGSSGLDPQLEELVRSIKEQIHMQVIVTLTCPFCPMMVRVAHKFAFANDNIRADMVEASEFSQLLEKYSVSAVPKTIINEIHSVEGFLPADAVHRELLKVVDPEEYRRFEELIREEFEAQRKSRMADSGFLPVVGLQKGRVLVDVVRNVKPKRVLEVGTYMGDSAIVIGRELESDAHLITIEIVRALASIARENIKWARVPPTIDVIAGDALKVIPKLTGNFDMVFIDAEKSEYFGYLRLVEDKLHTGSVIVADNAGVFADQIRDYLDYVRHSGKYRSKYVPVGEDGLEVSVKL